MKNIVNYLLKGIFIIFPLIHFFWFYNNFSFVKLLFLWFSMSIISLLVIFYKNKLIINNKYQFIFIVLTFWFLIISSLSLFNSLNIYTSFVWSINRYMWFLSYFYLFLYINYLALFLEENSFKNYFKLFVYIGFISSILWILYIFLWVHFDFRIIWTIWQYNVFWIFLIPAFLLGLYFYFEEKNKIYLFLAIFILVWIFLTKSRIAFILAIFWAFYIVFLYFKNIKKYFLVWFIIFLSLWLFFYKDRLALNEANNSSVISRIFILKYAFLWIKDFWLSKVLFWNWFETQKYILAKNSTPEIYLYEKVWELPDRVHNFFVDWFIEFWFFWIFILTILLLFFQLYLFLKLKNKQKLDKILIFILFSIFFWSLVWFNYLVNLFFSLFILIYFIKKYPSKNLEINYIYIKILFICLFILSFIWNIFLYKETVLNYKVKNYEKNSNYLKDILYSNNEQFKQNIFLYLFENKSLFIEKALWDFEKSYDQLSLHYALFYYIQAYNENSPNFEKVKYLTQKLLEVHPYNMYALWVKLDMCSQKADKNCINEIKQKVIKWLPKILFKNDKSLTEYQKIKKQKLLQFIFSYDTNYWNDIFSDTR